MKANAEVNVLSENNVKLDKLEKSIQAALKRKRKIIEDSKLFTYDKLSELYGMEGQAPLDAVAVEHNLIQKLTNSGMTYEQIGELADSDSSADKYGKQTSFSGSNHSYSE